jgi:hypothetical protein
LEKDIVSIIRAEVGMLGSGDIYIGLEEGKAEEVGQSGMRNEGEAALVNVGINLQAPQKARNFLTGCVY